VLADDRLSQEEHTRLIQEARDRNRASVALATGVGALIGAPETVTDTLPTNSTPTAAVPGVALPNLPAPAPTMEELMATVSALQEQLKKQSAPSDGSQGGIPPAITVTTRAAAPVPSPAPGGTSATAGAPLGVTGILHSPALGATAGSGQTVTFQGRTAPVLPPVVPLAAEKWYAVVVGRTPSDTGVYRDYATIAPMVVGVSGAVFRGSFGTKAEATAYLSSVSSIPVLTTPTRAKKWYVVVVGQDPLDRGVYDNWPEVAGKVLGVSGCVYQGGFRTQLEAETYLTQCPATSSKPTQPTPVPPPPVPPPPAPPHVIPPTQPPPQPYQPQPAAPLGHAPHSYPPQGFLPGQTYQPPYPPSQQYPSTPGPNTPGGWGPGTPHQGYGTHPFLGGGPPPHSYGHVGGSPYPSTPGGGGYFGTTPGTSGTAGAGPGTYPGPPGGGGYYGSSPGTPSTPGPGSGTYPGPPYTPGVGGGAYGGPSQPGTPGSPWAMPRRLVGADPSSGTKGQLWGVNANEDLSMLNAWSPPGMPLEKSVRFGDQALDAVGLPGTSAQGSDDFEMARLSDAFLMMATGREAMTHNLLQGTTDNGFKQDKRTTLGNVKSLEDLETRLECLNGNKDKVLEHVEGNLKIVLMGVGYTPDDAALLAHDSPFLRISTDCLHAYIGLHMHLLQVALKHGWEHTKSEQGYHVTKLKEIRGLYQTRLQVIAHNYCYLRDLQIQKWQTFGIQDLRIRELQMSLGVTAPTAAGVPPAAPFGGRGHYCNHCKTNLHPGNKASCLWKTSTAAEARRAGATALRRLGEGEDAIEDEG
jgi:hypothetical protein